jgi:hypothetical protein
MGVKRVSRVEDARNIARAIEDGRLVSGSYDCSAAPNLPTSMPQFSNKD